jgi:hypothetical protein
MNTAVFSDVTSCSLVETVFAACSLQIYCLTYFSIVKKEAVVPLNRRWVSTGTQRYIPENVNVQIIKLTVAF